MTLSSDRRVVTYPYKNPGFVAFLSYLILDRFTAVGHGNEADPCRQETDLP